MLCAQQHRWVVMRHSACFFFFFFFCYNKENMSSSKRHCQVTSFSHHKLCTSHVDEWNTLLGGMFNLFTEWKHHFLSQTTTAGTDSNKAQHPAGKKGAFKTQQICHQLNHLTFKKKNDEWIGGIWGWISSSEEDVTVCWRRWWKGLQIYLGKPFHTEAVRLFKLP